MFHNSSNSERDNFLKKTDDERQKRILEKKKLSAAIRIQCVYRGYKIRKEFFNGLKNDIQETVFLECPNQIFEYIQKYAFMIRHDKTSDDNLVIFDNICKHLINNITKSDIKHSYLSLIVTKDKYQCFLDQINKFLKLTIVNLSKLNIKHLQDSNRLSTYLTLIVTLTSHKLWKAFQSSTSNELLDKMLTGVEKSLMIQIGKQDILKSFDSILLQNSTSFSKPILKPTSLITIFTISLRILQSNNYSSVYLYDFFNLILFHPLLSKYLLDSYPNEFKEHLKESDIMNRIFSLVSSTENFDKLLFDKDLNQCLSFLGNLCSLVKLDFNHLTMSIECFTAINVHIFEYCSKFTNKSESLNNTIWHPLVGHTVFKSTPLNANILLGIFAQLRFLWSHQFIALLFEPNQASYTDENESKHNFKGFIRGIFDKAIVKRDINLKIHTNECLGIYRICTFYRKLLSLFNGSKIEILSALSVEEELIIGLWKFIQSLGQLCGLRDLLKLIEHDKCFVKHQIFDVYYLFSSLMHYLITIYDEYEFYEKQSIFKLDDYKQYSLFLNNFLYGIISSHHSNLDSKFIESNDFLSMLHQLVSLLFDKNCKRSFSGGSNDFWLVKEIKPKLFISDFEKFTPYTLKLLQLIPHVIPLKTRIEILQHLIAKDKASHSLVDHSTVIRIKIRRNRVVEDGYAQLMSLSNESFKRVVRVTFINEHGLSEAGIDQDGVFKEFLQELVKQILNPNFNLFKVTDDQLLYPSPSSYYVEDHLKLFEFIGKIFAKAIYEGHVVDIEFAPFFLRQLLGLRCQSYSFFDDLATLDRELYKQLSSVKRDYDDEMLDSLELNFTYMESHLGQVITHELVPSGGLIKVNSENKIKYIHLLALFKLHKQIKRQVCAFNEGFKSIIKQEWLQMFSIPEVQYLVSGSLQDIDFADLKANVQYWGGYFAAHRLIKWLWDILENDFSREDRSLFLKFVTSSSRPPLLGFASLNPPFTIRCVETNEEETTVYEASFSGFFKTLMNLNTKETSRLPTSSTCFNLLKLPNYSKKSTLKDKLKYAIWCNAGFELS